MCCWECKYLRWDGWWNPTFYCYNDSWNKQFKNPRKWVCKDFEESEES